MLPHDSPTHVDRTTPDGVSIGKYQDDVAIRTSTSTGDPVILIDDRYDEEEEKSRYKPKRPRNCFTNNSLNEKLGSHPPIGLYMLYYFCKVENFCHNLFISQKEILSRIFSSDDEKYQSAEFYKLVPSSLSDQLRVKLKAAMLLDNSNPWTDMYKDEHIANLDCIQKLDGMLPSNGFKTDGAMHWYFRGILAVLEFFCPMPISKKCLTNDTDEINFFTNILIQTNDERHAFLECPGPHRQKAFNYLFHLLMTFEYDRYVYLKSREYVKKQLEDNPIPTFYEDSSSPKSNRFYFHEFIPSGARAVTSKMLGSAVNTLIPDEWCNHQQLGIFMQWLQDKSVALGRKCHFHLPSVYMEDDLYHGNCFKDARLLFYPIHFNGNHWISVFAYRKTINEEDTWNFYYYDSLYKHFQEKKYVEAFEEYIAKKGSSVFFPKGHKRMIQIVPTSKSFIQRDGVNCGYFTMLCAFNLLKHIDDVDVLIKWSQTEIDIDNFKLSIYIRMCTKELMDKSITHYMPYYGDGANWRKRLDRGAVKI